MLDSNLSHWLDAEADALDRGVRDAEDVLPQLAAAGLLGLGVDERYGGAGGDTGAAVEAIAAVAGHSLTAAFVLWGQRTFIEYLLHTDNAGLRERLLGDLLGGRLAGATGLSNAMKYLSGIEELGVRAAPGDAGWQLDGRLPWVTNLRKHGFVVAAAVDLPGSAPFVAALPDGLPGLSRSDDLQLLGLQSSNTAALRLDAVQLERDWLLAADAQRYLRRVRPAFLGLQCGMTIGLARRALAETAGYLRNERLVLHAEWAALDERVQACTRILHQGLHDGRFVEAPASLFELRIALADIAAQAVQLELQASGGKAYLQQYGAGFARRWRESAFVPIVTPSLVQLRGELQRHAGAAA